MLHDEVLGDRVQHVLKRFLPDETSLHPVTKSEVVPMKVLFRDEKYVSETIEILLDLAKNAKLTGQSQVRHSTEVTNLHTEFVIDVCDNFYNAHSPIAGDSRRPAYMQKHSQ